MTLLVYYKIIVDNVFFCNFLSHLLLYDIFYYREFDLMFVEADQNNDGKIDFDEFVAMMLPATIVMQ